MQSHLDGCYLVNSPLSARYVDNEIQLDGRTATLIFSDYGTEEFQAEIDAEAVKSDLLPQHLGCESLQKVIGKKDDDGGLHIAMTVFSDSASIKHFRINRSQLEIGSDAQCRSRRHLVFADPHIETVANTTNPGDLKRRADVLKDSTNEPDMDVNRASTCARVVVPPPGAVQVSAFV